MRLMLGLLGVLIVCAGCAEKITIREARTRDLIAGAVVAADEHNRAAVRAAVLDLARLWSIGE